MGRGRNGKGRRERGQLRESRDRFVDNDEEEKEKKTNRSGSLSDST